MGLEVERWWVGGAGGWRLQVVGGVGGIAAHATAHTLSRSIAPCRFACLFTSHVANLLYYSPMKSYRGKADELLSADDLWM